MSASVRTALEARSGLDPWIPADLPAAPTPRGLGWIGVVGPGVIVLGASIGGGEYLLGPTVFVRHGLTLLWVTTIAIVFQTIFNTELMRYTLATGEPVFTGFMRTRPHSTFWGVVYAVLFFLQVGWPASAAVASGAIFFLGAGRLPGPADVSTVYYIGVATFLLCVTVLLVGRRIERTLEIANLVLVVVHTRRPADHGGPARAGRDLAGRSRRPRRLQPRQPAASISCRPTPTSSSSRRSSPTQAPAAC